jgi:predicted ATPase
MPDPRDELARASRVRELFALAVDVPPGKVETWLAEQAGADPWLIAEVKSLLAADAAATGFLSGGVVVPLSAVEADTAAAATVRSEPQALSPGTMVGPYELQSLLGAGGMGQVYEARHTRLNRQVALKLLSNQRLDPARVRRFEQEARAASALNHPNIVTVYDILDSDAGRCIAMELVRGRTLRDVIDQRPALDLSADLVRQAALALHVAHEAGIVHRDIKPENVMVRDDGYVKVLDFGLARAVPIGAAAGEAPAAPASRHVIGTIRYMSPEQTRGEALTVATDVFSLGIVLYELATGRHPFEGRTVAECLEATREHEPPSPVRLNPAVPAALDALIVEMLHKDPRLRPTADVVARTLAAAPQGRMGEGVPSMARSARRIVGREREQAELLAALDEARGGQGRMICVSGEPGIGKTTLVEAFLDAVEGGAAACRVVRGRCSERLAGTEGYLPWLEALENLIRDASGQPTPVAQVLETLAPAWFARVAPAAADTPHRGGAASADRLKHEMAALLRAISDAPLVVFFDDLHWADTSTVDLLAFVADRLDGLPILFVVTYRPSDLLIGRHAFAQVRRGLEARGRSRELPLDFLTRPDVDRLLALEFPEHQFPHDLGARLHARTEGNPLFLTDLVRYLRDRRVIAQDNRRWVLTESVEALDRDLPATVRSMIEFTIDRLDETDRRLLSAASVQGVEFDSTVVAEVLALTPADVEERLDVLERAHALVRLVEERQFPDRALTSRYRFTHVLYQNALFAALKPSRRVQLALALATALEAHWGEQVAHVANELAILFETAREFARAADYCRTAAINASQVFASREAEALARRGLTVIEMLPLGPDRVSRELSMQLVLGNALIATLGYSAPEVEQAFLRASEICRLMGDTPRLLPVHFGLSAFRIVRGQMREARTIGHEFIAVAERYQDPALLVGHRLVGITSFYLGELGLALEHLGRASALYEPARHRPLTALYGGEPEMDCRSYLGLSQWLTGFPDQALASHETALQIGRDVAHAHSRAHTLSFAGVQWQFRGDWQRVSAIVDEQLTLTAGQGLKMWRIYGRLMHGWVVTRQGDIADGVDEIQSALDDLQALGAQLFQPYFHALLAEALGDLGDPPAGLEVLDRAEAMTSRTEERFWDAELSRLRGELLAMSPNGNVGEIEHHLQRALAIAGSQGARSLALRAAMSLARFFERRGRTAEAYALLSAQYEPFREGLATADLAAARQLLAALSAAPP